MIIALVDDDEDQRNVTLPMMMNGFLNKKIPVARFDFFSSGEEFLQKWTPGSYDLIILDIVMGTMTGIEVGKEIRKRNPDVRIVFCSSSNEYAYESYSLNASYYIQKPATQEKVADMVDRLKLSDFELRRFITLPDGTKLILRNMIYSQYDNHQIIIYMNKGEEIRTRLSQVEFAQLLSPYPYFMSCNKGIILNLYMVERWTKSEFYLKNGEVIAVSRRRIKEIDAAYHDFLLNVVETSVF